MGVVLLIQPLAFVHALYYDCFEQMEEKKFNVIRWDSVLWLFSVYFFTKICYRIIGFVSFFYYYIKGLFGLSLFLLKLKIKTENTVTK